MAGPHVVGVVALLWQAHPALSRDIAATKALLNSTANPNISVSNGTQCGGIDHVPNNHFGYGLVDALAAYNGRRPASSATAASSASAATPPPRGSGRTSLRFRRTSSGRPRRVTARTCTASAVTRSRRRRRSTWSTAMTRRRTRGRRMAPLPQQGDRRLGRLLPADEQDLRLRRSPARRDDRAGHDPDLRHRVEHVVARARTCPRRGRRGRGLQPGQRQDLPERRLRDSTIDSIQNTTWEYDPVANTVHRQGSVTARCRAEPPPESSTAI